MEDRCGTDVMESPTGENVRIAGAHAPLLSWIGNREWSN